MAGRFLGGFWLMGAFFFGFEAAAKDRAAPAPAPAATPQKSSASMALPEPLILSQALKNSAAEAVSEEEKTEMALRNPLDVSERCCDRYDLGGEAHGWAPQKIAAFIKGDDSPSAPAEDAAPADGGSSSGSQ